MAQKVSILQEYFPTDWSGLTTKNHLGAIYQTQPQDATKLVTLLHKANGGFNFTHFLRKFEPLFLESDDDFRWRLQGDSEKNIPLVSASVAGSAVSATSKAGIANARFVLTFPEQYFSMTNVIVGEKNSVYPILIVEDPVPNGANWEYTCELLTGDQALFIPYDELTAGKRYSKDWSIVEKTLSQKGGTPNYTSPFSMKNIFSMVRMQDTRPGNMINRPVAFSWTGVDSDGNQKTMTTWMDYADWEFERQFNAMKDKLLNFATINRTSDGLFKQKGKSGYVIEQGAGIDQQMDSGNIAYYNDFDLDIKWLTEHIMDLSDDYSGYGDRREIMMRTGKWGAYKFSEAIRDYTQLYTPLRNTDQLAKQGDGWVYHENFTGYRGPDGTLISVFVDPAFDDKARNKVLHPSGKGVAKSYQYDIMNVGRVGGEDNVRLVYQKGMEDVWGYEPGLRHPFKTSGEPNLMANPKDGYIMHRAAVLGAMIKDPSRVARIIPSVLA